MRLAVVTHQFFPRYYTGVERIALNLVKQLALMGHECVVVTPASHSSGANQPYTHDGVRVRPLTAPPADLARPWLHDGMLAPRVGRVLDEERPDVVDVMQPMRLPQVFAEARRRKVPLVAHIADFYYLCTRVNMLRRNGSLCTGARGGDACVSACAVRPAHARLDWAQEALGSAAAVISPSRFTSDVHASEDFDTSRWAHIPWGVDYGLHPSRLAPPVHDQLVVGFIGSLLPHKGPHVLVEVMQLLRDADIELRLYGGSFHEKAYEADLRRMAAGDPRIRFEGPYEHRQLPGLLAELDVVAIPSLWHENLPTTGLNAVAAGVPLVVSNVGGLGELVDDYECGLRFRVGDVHGLAILLDGLIRDRTSLARIRRRMMYPSALEEEASRLEDVYRTASRQP